MKVRSLFLFLMLFFFDGVWGLSVFGEENISSLLYHKIATFGCLVFSIGSLSFNKTRIRRGGLYNKFWYLFFISIIFSFLLGSYAIFGEPLNKILNALFWFSSGLIYFALSRSYSSRENLDVVINTFVWYGLAAALFSVITSFFYSPDIFSTTTINHDASERFGFTRIAGIAENSIIFTFFYALVAISNQDKRFLVNLFLIFITGLSIFAIAASRQIILSAIVVIVLFSLKGLFYRKRHGFALLSLMAGFLLLPFMSIYLLVILDSINVNTGNELDGSSFAIRGLAIAYYFEYFQMTNWIGFGWMPTYEDASANFLSEATNTLNFRLVDLGVATVLFTHGIAGVLLVLLFYYISFRALKNNNDSVSLTIRCFLLLKFLTFNYLFYWPSFTFFFAILAFGIDTISREANARFETKK
ncbi:hypothetical protein N9L59_06350 [Luminiphilus sp.]|nr:hypothetical protein [Luminiphilus sp.]